MINLKKNKADALRKRIQIHSKRRKHHFNMAHKRRQELFNMVPEEKHDQFRMVLGSYSDYVRFEDAASRKLFQLTEELKEYDQ